ncbi:MAG: zinc carboxypeptidase [Treponema sp.]|jgi:hypothetical protein|nr:zinc carboxypeptidase [Treponema sp.]
MKPIYQKLLDAIPDYQVFPRVDEMDESSLRLAAEYPGVVSIFEIGKTREQHPLYCLKIEGGKQNALIFGLPHPNEPIGVMLMEYFTRALAEDAELRRELGYTWYVVKAWDSDGARLNEAWFKGPFTVSNYIRNFYRPAGREQVEWTFPVDYKELHFHNSLPETQAMMRLIDDIKPRFMYSLHNSGFGGVYWYMTKPLGELFDALHAIPAKYRTPMHLGEPETPACVEYAKAIYAGLGVTAEYDYMEKYGAMDMKEFARLLGCGDCSASYAGQKYGSFTLLTELPYFYDPRIEDQTPSDISRGEAVLQKTREDLELTAKQRAVLDLSRRYLSPDNHFMLAAEAFTSMSGDNAEAIKKLVAENPEYAKPATGAEKFDNLLVAKFYRALVFALLRRANESELEKMKSAGEDDPEKRKTLNEAAVQAGEALEEMLKYLEENFQYQVVPIKNLVSIQLESGLLVADYLKEHPEL